MSGPITNYELGKMLHREYEAEVSWHWGQEVTSNEKPSALLSRIYRTFSYKTAEKLHQFALARLVARFLP